MAKKARTMERKESRWRHVKSVNEAEGIVEHIITVFGVIDYGQDRSHPGSFRKTISERAPQDIRVLDMHNTTSIMDIVGKPIAIKEISRDELPDEITEEYPEATGGVLATTQFFLETPEGKGAFIRIKEGTVEWSYGYDALDYDNETVKRGGNDVTIRNLRAIKLYEYGPVLFGMVPGTATLSAKGDDVSDEELKDDSSEVAVKTTIRTLTEDEAERFWDKVEKTDDGCWLWTGALGHNGYGLWKLDGTTLRAHRVSYTEANGEIPEGKLLCHSCDNRNCVNPDHLAPCTEAENNAPEVDEEDDEKQVDLSARIDKVRSAFNALYNSDEDSIWRHWVNTVYDTHVIVQYEEDDGIQKWYQIAYTMADETITFAPREDWIPGEYTFTPDTEKAKQTRAVLKAFLEDADAVLNNKAGRVLASRNATRIGTALTELISVLQDAGVEVEGLTGPTIEEDEDDGDGKADKELNGSQRDWLLEIEQGELDLLELSSDHTHP